MAEGSPPMNLWHRLIQVTKSWPTSAFRSPVAHAPISIPPLQLPEGDLSFLAPGVLPPEIMEEVRAKALSAIENIKGIMAKYYHQSCADYVASREARTASSVSHATFFDTTHKFYEATYERQLSKISENFLVLCEGYEKQDLAHAAESKKPFNNDYLPLLEKYFEYQPFPSTRDRQWLAAKSGNTAEQIATWFQNHRRRAREAGKVIEKLPSHLQHVEIPLEELELKLSPLLPAKASIRRSESVGSERSFSTPPPEFPTPQQRTPSSLLLGATIAPPSAFPAKFTSQAVDENSPCRKRKFQCDPPSWRRQPATKRPRYKPYTVEQCCDSVQTSMRIVGKVKKRGSHTEPWFTSRSSGPLAAPHPASLPSCTLARSPSPGPSREPSMPPPRRTTTPRCKIAKPYEFRNLASPRTPLCSRSSIPRVASNSSIASSGSSASEAEGPITPEASPTYFSISLPIVHDDHDTDSLFGPDQDYPSPIPCSFGKPSLLASQPRNRTCSSSTRSMLQRYGFARFTHRKASLINATDLS